MLKRIKPCTPGQRHIVRIKVDTEGGVKKVPLSLRVGKRQKSGRNNRGRITVRHRGGGKKRLLRSIRGYKTNGVRKQREKRIEKSSVDLLKELKEMEAGREGKVVGVQYDPNRTARLALLEVSYSRPQIKEKGKEKEYAYVLAAEGLKVGDHIKLGTGKNYQSESEYSRVGSTLKRKEIPVGSNVFNIELVAGQGGKYVRTAGTCATLLRKPEGKALLRLPSGTIIEVSLECKATVGRVAGEEHRMEVIGKAGRMRNKGWRPSVRGEAMNPIDHPHGGRTRGGRPEVTPWGRIAKGKKTRDSKKVSRWVVKNVG